MRVIDRICDALAVFAGIYLVGIMLGIVISALARTFNLSGSWSSHIFTFSEFGLLYIVMAASPWLARHKGHVFIDAVTQLLPSTARFYVAKFVYLVCIISCLTFSYYSGQLLITAIVDSQIDLRAVDVPQWALLLPIPFAFFMVAIEFIRFLLGFDSMYGDRSDVKDNV